MAQKRGLYKKRLAELLSASDAIRGLTTVAPAFELWRQRAWDTLEQAFGTNSPYYMSFRAVYWARVDFYGGAGTQHDPAIFAAAMDSAVSTLRDAIEDLDFEDAIQSDSRRSAAEPKTVVYNVTGTNNRVNVNSRDQSSNMVMTAREELFDKLRGRITAGIPVEQERDAILRAVDDMQQAMDKPMLFTPAYKSFVSLVADHLSLVQAFLPALAHLLE